MHERARGLGDASIKLTRCAFRKLLPSTRTVGRIVRRGDTRLPYTATAVTSLFILIAPPYPFPMVVLDSCECRCPRHPIRDLTHEVMYFSKSRLTADDVGKTPRTKTDPTDPKNDGKPGDSS